MKTRKRTFVKTVFLSLVRYERWKQNPKNFDKMLYSIQMHHMIGFTWIICLLFFVSSCKPVQQITKTKTDSVATVSTHVKTHSEQTQTTTEQEKSITTAQNESSKSIVEIGEDKSIISGTLVVYDTSKPVDEHTGKPPIKSELNWSKKNDTSKGKVESSNISNQLNNENSSEFKQVAKSNDSSDINQKSNAKVKKSITEELFANTSVILFVIIGIAIVIYFVVSKTTPVGLIMKIFHFLFK